jgi:hypothetical protein
MAATITQIYFNNHFFYFRAHLNINTYLNKAGQLCIIIIAFKTIMVKITETRAMEKKMLYIFQLL